MIFKRGEHMTAAECVHRGIPLIEAKLDEIREHIRAKYDTLPDATLNRNWGYVGDLGHVMSELEDLAKFLKSAAR